MTSYCFLWLIHEPLFKLDKHHESAVLVRCFVEMMDSLPISINQNQFLINARNVFRWRWKIHWMQHLLRTYTFVALYRYLVRKNVQQQWSWNCNTTRHKIWACELLLFKVWKAFKVATKSKVCTAQNVSFTN